MPLRAYWMRNSIYNHVLGALECFAHWVSSYLFSLIRPVHGQIVSFGVAPARDMCSVACRRLMTFLRDA